MRIGEGAETVNVYGVGSNAVKPLSEGEFIESLKKSYRQKDTIPLLIGGKLSIENHYTALAIITDKERQERKERLKKPDSRPTTYETIFSAERTN